MTPELRMQALIILAAHYAAYHAAGVTEPHTLATILWTLDDLIADAADPDYPQPDPRRLRDLTTVSYYRG